MILRILVYYCCAIISSPPIQGNNVTKTHEFKEIEGNQENVTKQKE